MKRGPFDNLTSAERAMVAHLADVDHRTRAARGRLAWREWATQTGLGVLAGVLFAAAMQVYLFTRPRWPDFAHWPGNLGAGVLALCSLGCAVYMLRAHPHRWWFLALALGVALVETVAVVLLQPFHM